MRLIHLAATLLATAATLAGLPAGAQTAGSGYPNRPIKLIIGYTPGGAADYIARIVGEALSKELGQTIVVDNKPGANSTLASSLLTQAPPDGYTLGLANNTIYGVDQHVYKVKYTGEHFAPVTRLTISPLILAVNKDAGMGDLNQLVAKAKANPGKVNFSSSGVGGLAHVAGLAFERAVGAKMTHVPYKGGAPALQAVASGEVELSFGTASSVLPLGRQGMVRMLGVSTLEPSEVVPDLPPLASLGLPGFDFNFWFGLFGPAGMPKEITDKLYAATARVLADPQVRAKLATSGNAAAPSRSPSEFHQWAMKDGKVGLERVVQAGVKAE